MARKLFISFLGTSFYQECTYYDDKGEYAKTRYIQCATLEQVGAKEWSAEDAVRIFVTDKAQTSNWDKNITERKLKDDTFPYTGLEADICAMNLAASVKAVTVSDGKDEKEIWSIFEAIYDEIKDDDELYIDLTHAFRYLPMLILVLSNYAKLLKHIKVAHLSYGNYEARDSKSNKAPIVSLLPLTMLQDWTSAAAEFIRHGYADSLKGIIENELKPLLKNTATRTENVKEVRKLGTRLDDYVQERIFCRGMKLSSGARTTELREQLDIIEDTGIAPLNPIFKLLKKTTDVQPDIPMRCCEAAQWCYDRRLYQQAITLLQEGVNTFFCLRHAIRIDDENTRDYVGQAFHMMKEVYEEEYKSKKDPAYKKKVTLDDYMAQTAFNPVKRSLLMDKLVRDHDVTNKYTVLSGTRNDYNHSGFRSKREPLKPKDIKGPISDALAFFHDLFANNPIATDIAPATDTSSEKKVFVNLSNHPLALWDEAQKSAAAQYGEPVDMPFPQIPVDASYADIKALAQATLRQLAERHAGTVLTVHIMGEMTFTYAMVHLLKSCGVRCVASCTERSVEDLGQGNKVSHFKFVCFRAY